MRKRVVVKGAPVLNTSIDGTVYTVDNPCTHGDSPLPPACLRAEPVSCTPHGSRCSVNTGERREAPASRVVRVGDDSIRLQADT